MASLNLEQERRVLKQAIDNGRFPNILYKYRSIDSAMMILENFSFWFANPNSFNDPFDCSLSEVNSYCAEDARAFFKRIGTPEKDIIKFLGELNKDPNGFKNLVSKAREGSINERGILCLSKTHDNILMWSHYAQNHEGVVFGLEMEKDLDFFLKPINIEYQDEYQVVNYLKNPDLSTSQTLKVKSLQWAYEEEVRIYKKEAGLKRITPRAISEIYFGVKTSEEDIQKIMSLCKTKGLNYISFLKGNKKHGEFGIDFTKI